MRPIACVSQNLLKELTEALRIKEATVSKARHAILWAVEEGTLAKLEWCLQHKAFFKPDVTSDQHGRTAHP